MRININLATEPYEDARRFYLKWSLLLLLLALITAGLVSYAAKTYMASRAIASQVDQERARIAELDRERAQAEAILNRQENRDVRDKSRFLNALIVRKAFSWTQVFSDLERMVPPRVRIVSIHPGINANNQLEIHIEAVGDSRDKALDLVRRMEESPTFREPQVRVERPAETGSAGVNFSIVAQYIPPLRRELQ
jgi:Tfp pilus assembly protein PilN